MKSKNNNNNNRNKKNQAQNEEKEHGHLSIQNIVNIIQIFVVAIPAIYLARLIYNKCTYDPLIASQESRDWKWDERMIIKSFSDFCYVGIYHPILMVNYIYFFNVNVLFWILSLIQNSTWLIVIKKKKKFFFKIFTAFFLISFFF